MGWDGWPLERALLLLVGLLFVGIFVQVTLSHDRQNFRAKAMWIPVLATPLLAIASFALVGYDVDWLRVVTTALFVIGAAAGLYGFFLHFIGVGRRVRGHTRDNFMIGPPVVMPLVIVLSSAIGLLALQWSVIAP